MAGNVLRGAFGAALREQVCGPDCAGGHRQGCLYARMFEPRATRGGPSGFADWPRPFVFRVRELDGRTFAAGDRFGFGMHLFEVREPGIASIAETFARLADEGLGPGRGRADFLGVESLGADGELSDGPMELSLEPPAERVERVAVEFLTPFELKSEGRLLERPEFGALAARIRDRVSLLRELYGEGPAAVDFKGFGERAARVRMTRCEIARVETARRSSRTGQTHSIGGFTGEAEYEGELREFVPWLRAAEWTGVGRQTVWGKGEIRVRVWAGSR